MSAPPPYVPRGNPPPYQPRRRRFRLRPKRKGPKPQKSRGKRAYIKMGSSNKRVLVDFDGAFATSMSVILKTSISLSEGAASGAVSAFTIQGNSVRDPFGDSGNTQPAGFDNLLGANGPYNTYRVSAAELTLDLINTSSSVIAYWCLYTSDDSTPLTTMNDARSQPFAQYGILALNSATPEAHVKMGATTRGVIGRKLYTEGKSAHGSDPADIWHFHFLVQDVAASGTSAVRVNANLRQLTTLTDPIPLLQST